MPEGRIIPSQMVGSVDPLWYPLPQHSNDPIVLRHFAWEVHGAPVLLEFSVFQSPLTHSSISISELEEKTTEGDGSYRGNNIPPILLSAGGDIPIQVEVFLSFLMNPWGQQRKDPWVLTQTAWDEHEFPDTLDFCVAQSPVVHSSISKIPKVSSREQAKPKKFTRFFTCFVSAVTITEVKEVARTCTNGWISWISFISFRTTGKWSNFVNTLSL